MLAGGSKSLRGDDPAEILKSYAKGVQEVKIANYAERKDLTEALRPYEAFMMKIQ